MSEREHRDDNEDDILYIYIYILSCTCQPKQNKKVSTKQRGGRRRRFCCWHPVRRCGHRPGLAWWGGLRRDTLSNEAGPWQFPQGSPHQVRSSSFLGGPKTKHHAALRALCGAMPAATGVIIQKNKNRGHAQGSGHLLGNNRAPCL